ncbi:restriction endonuclease subunit S [Vibrio vulnificus]|nr:restriction endonuclease subunit S [Vibrio vulnificus]EJZ7973550.1 restriction endonuclease subunit S [Vibrio vulnificus]MCU8236186.1 restriction endonuclease subunit S [Vibrio vulnificus]
MNQAEFKTGWSKLKLSDVIKVKSGESLSKSKMEDGIFPVFGGNGITGYHSSYNSDNIKLVIGRVGEYCGAVYKTPTLSWITDNALYVNEKKLDVGDEYLYFLLCHLELNEYANRNAQPLVSGKTLEQVFCTLPSCPIEQQKIAEILSTVDEKIDLINQKIAETEKLKTGLMQKLFSEGVGVQDSDGNWQPHSEFQDSPFGKIPKCWSVDSLGEHTVKVGSGVTPKGGSKAYVDSGIPLIRSQNVLFGKFKLDDVAFITEQQHDKMKGSKLQPRDVLLNITGASIGRCAVLPEDFDEGNVNQHVCIIRTSEAIDPDFCGWFLNSKLGQKQIWNLQAGGNREGLNFQQIRSFKIPVFSIEEQCSIVEILSTVSDKLNLLETQKAETQQLKKGLMQKLLTGEWRVPLDNPEAA